MEGARRHERSLLLGAERSRGPADGLDRSPRKVAAPNSAPAREEWLWPTGGGLIAKNAAGSRRLFLFYFRIAREPRRKGVWGFSVVGTALVTVENVSESAERWKPRLSDIPYSNTSTTSARHPIDAPITWGMSAFVDSQSAPLEPSRALIYGVRKSGQATDSLLLARSPAFTIDRFQDWTFYAGKTSWAPAVSESAPLAVGVVPEFSVERIANRQKTAWMLVQSEAWLGKHILVRTAPRPEGPWSPAATIATVRDVERSPSYFTYAAKGHIELSRPGELLVSYLVNSNQFSDLMRDTQIYRPQFLRVSLSFLNPR